MPRGLPPMGGAAAALPKGPPLTHLDVPPLPLPVVTSPTPSDPEDALASARSVGSDGGILKQVHAKPH